MDKFSAPARPGSKAGLPATRGSYFARAEQMAEPIPEDDILIPKQSIGTCLNGGFPDLAFERELRTRYESVRALLNIAQRLNKLDEIRNCACG